jgi:molybdopterin molybdotransferase
MPFRLTPIPEALSPVLGRITPVHPKIIAAADALGMVLASPLRSAAPVPMRAVALRSGLAIRAADTVGASAYSPVLLKGVPTEVAAGAALPEGFNAVLPLDAAIHRGNLVEIAESVAPGEGVRLVGHDLRAGVLIAHRGTLVSPTLQLVLACAGIDTVEISAPIVAIAPGFSASVAWLSAQLTALGCVLTGDNCRNDVHLAINWAADDRPVLACNPGETGFVVATPGGRAEITMPVRFDGLVAIFVLLVRPVVEALMGQSQPPVMRPLARKIASTIGLTEVVVLKGVDDRYMPLCVGEITLSALAAADAIASVPPDSEGLPKGAMVAATPFTYHP